VITVDLHPDYLATRYGRQRAEDENLPLIEVQHHHAHLAACLADNQWSDEEPVIGLILDGTGYGTDGTIWGGEVLVGGYEGFQRRFHLEEFPLPGGDSGIRTPSRIALALLWKTGFEWNPAIPAVSALSSEEKTILRAQLEKKINTPLTSSMGRLFDAVSSLVGVRSRVNYEGQAAIELESLCSLAESGAYSFDLALDQIQLTRFLGDLLADILAGLSAPVIAAKFHMARPVICRTLPAGSC